MTTWFISFERVSVFTTALDVNISHTGDENMEKTSSMLSCCTAKFSQLSWSEATCNGRRVYVTSVFDLVTITRSLQTRWKMLCTILPPCFITSKQSTCASCTNLNTVACLNTKMGLKFICVHILQWFCNLSRLRTIKLFSAVSDWKHQS